jgi:hypothetical protein
MKHTSIISARLEELYTILSAVEKKELERFLASPYFNRNNSLLLLHQFLSEVNVTDKKYNKAVAWRAVFKNVSYNEKKFRYLVSDMLAAIDDFIFINEMLKTKPSDIHLLDEYYSVHDAPLSKASLTTKIVSGNKSKHLIKTPAYYLQQHYEQELLEELNSASLKNYLKYIKRNRSEAAGGLDIFYVIEKLRQLCLFANDNNIFGVNMNTYQQQRVLKEAATFPFNENIFVQAYLNVYRMLTLRSEKYYFCLIEILQKHGFEIALNNLVELFTYARNFCIARINAGQHHFYTEIFELYKQGLDKNILLPNGQINKINFKNIVTTGLRIGEHVWVFDFIQQYQYKLNKSLRNDAYHYNFANYCFHTRQFDKALKSLQKVQLNDLFYGLDARSLMLKCYYELDEKEAFLNTYFSFRMFVQRRKNVSEQHRKNYLNFLRVSKKLMNIRPSNKQSVLKIQREIYNSKALADKNWLEAKVKVFIN